MKINETSDILQYKVASNITDFMKNSNNFPIERFLSCNTASELETVREDLGIFLKYLKISMINLINAHYKDLIFLATSLKDLRSKVQILRVNLKLLKTKIFQINHVMKHHCVFLEKLILEKYLLRTIRKAILSLQRLKYYLVYFSYNQTDSINRLIHFVFYHKFRLNKNVNINCKTDGENVSRDHELEFEKKFLCCLKNPKQAEMYRILLTSSVINCSALVEKAFRFNFVRKFIDKEVGVLVENHISYNTLSNFFKNLLDFISLNMRDLLFLTIYNKKFEGPNFLIESFWIEIVQQMQIKLSLLFCPGDPLLFLARWKLTESFLSKIEKLAGTKNNVKMIRKNQKTKQFIKCWNFGVFFQIKVHQILHGLEGSNQNLPVSLKSELNANEFNIEIFKIADLALFKFWSNEIYNRMLYSKLLKVTIQIISRINKWVHQTLNMENINTETITLFIIMYTDCDLFCKKLSLYFGLLKERIPEEIQKSKHLLEKCFLISQESCLYYKDLVGTRLSKALTDQSCAQLKFVADLSRVYRKTKRDLPNERSNYVYKMIQPFEYVKANHSKLFGENIFKNLLLTCFIEITEKFLNCVKEITFSIKRTEESLKRLKKVRSKLPQKNKVEESIYIGDDEKIRMQLRIDVLFWIDEMNKFVDIQQVPNLESLKYLVENTNSIKNK